MMFPMPLRIQKGYGFTFLISDEMFFNNPINIDNKYTYLHYN